MAKRNYVLRFADGSRDPRQVSLEADTLDVEGLPEFSAEDAGKHLVVNQAGDDVEWDEVPEELPSFTAEDVGKHLVVNAEGTNVEWDEVPAAELPTFVVGDAGKHLAINAAGTGLEWVTPFALPALPGDAAEKTYALQAVNGVLSWVEVTAGE